ncbi:MAG: CYTH domain-containing protein [Pontiellaceae bacterium]|nr:CYTH domain-containing protein [Pontiellaceae bacterium]
MKQEIERKFLVVSDGWRESADSGRACRQGYITGSREVTVRVRVIGDQGYLTLKGPASGISRAELEYEIPAADAEYMLANFCTGGIVSKVRYISFQNGLRWEIDEFSGANQGLVVAEIELKSENQIFNKPDWLGEEVSFDPRYTNAALSRNPFSAWMPG